MTDTATINEQATSSLRMILTLTVVSMLSGITIVLVYLVTFPIIEENKRLAIEAAVLNVIPDSASYMAFQVNGDQLQPVGEGPADKSKDKGKDKGKGLLFYLGYDGTGKPIGLAAPTNAQGYADKVYVIYGYRFDCECITGVKVIKHAETPGLGDKVITDKTFVANFDALEAKVNDEALINPIITVKHGTKKHPWEVDAISGATITSRAIGRALNASANILLPQVVKFRSQLETRQEEAKNNENG